MPDYIAVFAVIIVGVLMGFIGVMALEFLERLFEF